MYYFQENKKCDLILARKSISFYLDQEKVLVLEVKQNIKQSIWKLLIKCFIVNLFLSKR